MSEADLLPYGSLSEREKIVESTAMLFSALTDEERATITSYYCKHCWRPQPEYGCQCWNDE